MNPQIAGLEAVIRGHRTLARASAAERHTLGKPGAGDIGAALSYY